MTVGNTFPLLITVRNTFPLIITVGNSFRLVITVRNTSLSVLTVENTFSLLVTVGKNNGSSFFLKKRGTSEMSSMGHHISFNSNFVQSCLKNDKYNNIQENLQKNVLNLKELIFYKHPNFSSTDPNINITSLTCFNYYLKNYFCKL